MSRLFLPGLPIEVAVVGKVTPQRFTWAKRQHPVNRIENFWITELGWWHPDHAIARDYFLLTTKTGLLVEIYHSHKDDCWYLQRLHD